MKEVSITNLNNILIRILNLYRVIIEDKTQTMAIVLKNISVDNTNIPAVLKAVEEESIRCYQRVSEVDMLMVEFEKEFGDTSNETLH